MTMKLKVLDFIKANIDWEQKLSVAPYCLKISHDEIFGHKLVMLKYNQIDSDFGSDIVCECRGIVFDETDPSDIKPISIPYFKFFNFGEIHAATIDWSTAVCTEKIDGSLMKVVKLSDGNLLISTNGCINAFKCNLPESVNRDKDGCQFKTFGELFIHAVKLEAKRHNIDDNSAIDWFKSYLNIGYTYMFELVSPYSRIVVPHTETKLYFHGWRNNQTLEEIPFIDSDLFIAFSSPKLFALKSIDDCVKAASELPWDEEGYVVFDKDFNRIKIKSIEYVKIHRLANNGNMSPRRAVELWIEGDYEEVLAYFPEYRPTFDKIQNAFDTTVQKIDSLYHDLMVIDLHNRKDQATWIFKNAGKKYAGTLFHMLDHDCLAAERLKEFATMRLDSFIDLIGLDI